MVTNELSYFQIVVFVSCTAVMEVHDAYTTTLLCNKTKGSCAPHEPFDELHMQTMQLFVQLEQPLWALAKLDTQP